MIVPARLSPGDPITLVAPSGPVPKARLDAGLAVLGSRYDVRFSPRILDRTGYLAGDDDARLLELHAALESDTRAIFCARGGYGAMRILHRIDAALVRRQAKLLVGFSDITALHALWLKAGVSCVHGPTATHLGELGVSDHEALFDLVEGKVPAPWSGLGSVGSRETASGLVVGGNLELVAALIGTPFAFPLAGNVLLIEEVGERPYRIDRSLTQLALTGGLQQLAGVLVGGLTRCTEPDGSGPSAEQVIADRLGALGIPVLTGLEVGHGPRNLAIALGRTVSLDGSAGTLRFLSAATVS